MGVLKNQIGRQLAPRLTSVAPGLTQSFVRESLARAIAADPAPATFENTIVALERSGIGSGALLPQEVVVEDGLADVPHRDPAAVLDAPDRGGCSRDPVADRAVHEPGGRRPPGHGSRAHGRQSGGAGDDHR